MYYWKRYGHVGVGSRHHMKTDVSISGVTIVLNRAVCDGERAKYAAGVLDVHVILAPAAHDDTCHASCAGQLSEINTRFLKHPIVSVNSVNR